MSEREISLTEKERDAADAWLTLAEIAEELRVNPATVRQWVSKGQLKASRAGVRKWIVRRSDLERMVAATSPPAEVAEAFETPPDASREVRPDVPTTDANSAIALYQIAGDAFEAAFAASSYPPPSQGYLERMRRFADACEHMASTMANASKVAGVQWLGRSGFRVDSFPYELRPGGNRPGSDELWQDCDSAMERLAIAASGTELETVARAFRDVGGTLLDVADQLEHDDSWQVGSRAG
jgi:excisionase family DNA binding protein